MNVSESKCLTSNIGIPRSVIAQQHLRIRTYLGPTVPLVLPLVLRGAGVTGGKYNNNHLEAIELPGTTITDGKPHDTFSTDTIPDVPGKFNYELLTMFLVFTGTFFFAKSLQGSRVHWKEYIDIHKILTS